MVTDITHIFVKITRNSVWKLYYINLCYIDAHEKQQQSYVDDDSRGGDNSLPSNVTTEALVSISTTFDFIDCWLKFFDQNYLEHSNM